MSNDSKRPSSVFWSLPASPAGKWTTRLLLLTLGLMLANVVVVLPLTERQASLEAARAGFAWIVVLSLLAAGVSGLIALVRGRDRSWVIWTAMLASTLIIGFEVAGIFISG